MDMICAEGKDHASNEILFKKFSDIYLPYCVITKDYNKYCEDARSRQVMILNTWGQQSKVTDSAQEMDNI